MALPTLRDELAIHPGPFGHDGSPSWSLQDPLANRFFRLSWPAFEILSRWSLGAPGAIVESVRHETTLSIGEEDVLDLARFLGANQLLKPEGVKGTERLLTLLDSQKTSWVTWLLHHYLFFRIPLIKPDRLLDRLLPHAKPLASKTFFIATLAALAIGLFLLGRQWELFKASLAGYASLGGFVAFGAALGLSKIVHELGHALLAKAQGCRVPTMGLAFLVMWPMLYTDVTEAWKLADRKKRLLIGGGGVLAELALAAWATLFWGVLPEGVLREAAFTLAATTWLSSLVINLSPFMRFDGYFLMADAMNMPNLHARSFALARWHLRELLFDLREEVPEHLPRGLRAFLISFAWLVWIYRLVLFLGIALLVYHFFIKAIGIVLFTVEIGWFVLRPLLGEIAEWKKRQDDIRGSPRSRRTLGWGLALLMLLIMPWSGRVTAPAVLKAAEQVKLHAPSPSILLSIDVKEGQRLSAGEVVAQLDNPDLLYRQGQAARRIFTLKYELSAISFETEFRSRAQSIAKELDAAEAQQTALAEELDRLVLTSPINGTAVDISPELQAGQWIGRTNPILTIRKDAAIEAYVAETDLERIEVGDGATYIPEGKGKSLDATVVSIDKTASKSLATLVLASIHGGAIPAHANRQNLVPEVAVYRVVLALSDSIEAQEVRRGVVHIEGERRSLLGGLLRSAMAVVLREWGM